MGGAAEGDEAGGRGGTPGRATAGARLRAALRWLLRAPAARSVFFNFTLTRLIVLVVLVFAGQINLVVYSTGPSERHMRLSVGKVPVARVLRDTVNVADVNWYQGIAERGYERRPFDAGSEHNWAFFPLFPLLWRAAFALTGEWVVTGVVLSNLLFLCALFAVYGAAREFGLGHEAADRALFYLAAFPTSHFFSLPMTESLFLLLTAASLLAGKRRAWWLAAALGALASATRVLGIVLLPALALLQLQTYGRGWWRRPGVLWLCLVPAGLASFMLYLHAVTGNALAFKDALAAWGRRPGFFLVPFWHYFREPQMIAVPWDFRLLNALWPLFSLGCGLLLLRRREWALGAYVVLALVAALSSQALQSQARYAMVLFPVFFVLSEMAAPRPRLDQVIRAVSLVMLGLLTAMYAGHFSLAMA
jgi:hypothetical protein